MDTVFGDVVAKRKEMAAHFAATCDFFSVPCINAGDITESCEEDGIHFTADTRQILGQYLARYITEKMSL